MSEAGTVRLMIDLIVAYSYSIKVKKAVEQMFSRLFSTAFHSYFSLIFKAILSSSN